MVSIPSKSPDSPTPKKSPLADFVAVRQATFVSRYQPSWQAFDDICDSMGVALPFANDKRHVQNLAQSAGNYKLANADKVNHAAKIKPLAAIRSLSCIAKFANIMPSHDNAIIARSWLLNYTNA